MGGHPVIGRALRLVRGHGVDGGEDLPCGHLHVRQKADAQGALQVGEV